MGRLSGSAGGSGLWVGGRRAGVVVLVLGALSGVVSASGWTSVPLELSDGSAWLVRSNGDAVRGSAATGQADWLIENAVDADGVDQASVAQDGDVTVVVDDVRERAFTIDAVTLDIGESTSIESETVPYVAGDQVYLVSDGLVRYLDPVTFEQLGEIGLPGRVAAAIDSDGVLWVVTPRDGVLRQIVRGEVLAQHRVAEPGTGLGVTVAAGRPVVVDGGGGRVWFVDGRGRVGDPVRVELGEDVRLQGPSADGTRLWLATDEQVLGVSGDGAAPLAISVTGPRRPEVVGEQVIVPTSEGRVLVLDEATGEAVLDGPVSLPAAAEDDFVTFVKDGDVWFNSPSAQVSGTIAADGTVQLIEVDEDGLRHRRDHTVDPNEPLVPDEVSSDDVPAPDAQSAPAPVAEPAPAAQPPPPPVETPAPPPGPPPAPEPVPEPDPVPETTTTTEETTTTTTTVPDVDVPDVAGEDVDAACSRIEDAGLTCARQDTGEYATPAGSVLSQEPAAGATVAPGTTVTVRYNESAGVVVPAAGPRRGNACAPIEAAGLGCNLVPRRATTAVAPNEVLGQQPAAGGRVGPGSMVNVEHDNHSSATVYRFTPPDAGSWELVLSTDPNARAGWNRVELGVIFTEAAPGTQPVYCWEPNGVGDNQSNVYSNDGGGGDNIAGYHRRCGQQVLGYSAGSGHQPDHFPVYAYIGNSDHFYSTSASDPAGARYLARNPSSGPDVYFHLW